MITLHRCMTKVVTSEAGESPSGFSGITARRGILTVTDEALEFSGWTIRYEEIDEAILLSTRQWFIPGYLLRIRSRGTTYRFGLNWGRFWRGDLPFPVERGRARVRRTPLRMVVRGVLLALVICWLWQSCLSGMGT